MSNPLTLDLAAMKAHAEELICHLTDADPDESLWRFHFDGMLRDLAASLPEDVLRAELSRRQETEVPPSVLSHPDTCP